ncbi:hypothetical protein BDB00DRAFT_865121 [Zychaea mexicana]|uniref:uncharacterized protein n=1 Tax=Zychaea mexicana TaxID=64656 RepID=UPI0022FF4171|nr:uncharacterized protein BDB00DRAFT_865121 [Zychaea mexicana]KAI9467497.1 hypothetical protein BDB00DRAFT_865121 [Zychaea mexicana]
MIHYIISVYHCCSCSWIRVARDTGPVSSRLSAHPYFFSVTVNGTLIGVLNGDI